VLKENNYINNLNMKKILDHKYSFLLIALLFTNVFANSQEQVNKRAEWFVDARFGMFIHWGIYSGAEGIWKGEKDRDDANYAEWIQYRNQIDISEYTTLLDRFDWDKIDPEEWVLLAKKAGMKYVTFTAKHHDGFALWNSKASDYNVAAFTDPQRDIVKELAEACQKHGLKLGLYYSHWVDWEHPFGWDHEKEIKGISNEDYDVYWQEKVIPQMRELLTGYGPIGMIWFDMWIHHSRTVVSKKQLLQLKNLIRELQPDCIVNSRLGLSVEEDSDVDYQTLGDNQLGNEKKNFPWQSPATVAHSWGFHSLDSEWKSTTTLLQSLINNVSLNGNFMLNIGPKFNGDVPFEIVQRLEDMGNWLKINGESIYGCSAFDLPKNQHDWGSITYNPNQETKRLYLHVFHWPYNNKLTLTGVVAKPQKVYMLDDKQKTPLGFDHNTAITYIDLPAKPTDPYIPVVVVEYVDEPNTEVVVAQNMDGGFSFNPSNLLVENDDIKIVPKERRGTIPEHTVIKKKTSLQWRIFVDKPGEKAFDISYSFQEDQPNGSLVLKAAELKISHKFVPTGKTVGQPNANWVIDKFKSNRLGIIEFPDSGFYDIELEISPENNEEVKFQWLWAK
jgi:alpha-L-fucosidase